MPDLDRQTRGGGHSTYDAAKSDPSGCSAAAPAGDGDDAANSHPSGCSAAAPTGEAVGVVLRSRMAARPRLFSFADGQFRLSGQYFRSTMATPMKRSGSEDL